MNTGAARGKLLEVRELSVAFRRGERQSTAVERISFDIEAGETVALVGESGSGKTVTALSIMRLLPYPSAFHPSGAIHFKGADLLSAEETVMRGLRGQDIAMIFQEPMSSLNPLHKVERQVGELLSIHQGISGSRRHRRVLELLDIVGIKNPKARLENYPHQLSGGQRQRVMIAMALANNPDLLIADEPTTALDVTIQAQILTLLRHLRKEFGMALLLIAHDLAIVRKMADRVNVMTRGRIVEQGRAEDIFSNPAHAYTRNLLAARPAGKAPVACQSNKVVMTADHLKVYFPIRKGVFRRTLGYVKAVDGVSFSLRECETLGVVGESGSGKTTLGLALLRLIASRGRIVYLGRAIDGLNYRSMRPLRRALQIVFQDPYGSLAPRMSVARIVGEGLLVQNAGLSHGEKRKRIAEALDEVGLDPAAMDRYPHEFSGGQRQRIAIARAMVLAPRLVVLDEPTSALDMSVQAKIIDLLHDLQKKHRLSYLFISHDLKVVRALANTVMVMRRGRVVEHGAAVEIFRRPRADYTKALMAAAFELDVVGQDDSE
ncbi:MAG: ABC transporter ATP-binding protein [Hyphomicrobiales bacterium]